MEVTIMLIWKTSEIRAETHRGRYEVHSRSIFSHAYFTPWTGGCQCIDAPGFSSEREAVIQACVDHAAREPAHPPMSGWPADAELEAP
jgi:hypothetical protein